MEVAPGANLNQDISGSFEQKPVHLATSQEQGYDSSKKQRYSNENNDVTEEERHKRESEAKLPNSNRPSGQVFSYSFSTASKSGQTKAYSKSGGEGKPQPTRNKKKKKAEGKRTSKKKDIGRNQKESSYRTEGGDLPILPHITKDVEQKGSLPLAKAWQPSR